MINSIIQSIIENKDFLEKSLEKLIKRKKINTKLKNMINNSKKYKNGR